MPIFETIETEGVPVKIFTDQIEAKARQWSDPQKL
jgi:hypothetical protein